MEWLGIEKNVAVTIPVPLFQLDGVNPFAGAVPIAGDVRVYIGTGAPANITALPTLQGKVWLIALTAAEVNSDFTVVELIDTSDPMLWLPMYLCITTLSGARRHLMQVALSELATLPGATPTLEQAVMLNYEDRNNKEVTDGTTKKLYKADGTTVLATWTITKASGVITRARAV